MKINDTRKEKKYDYFDDLEIGEAFFCGEELYIKIARWNGTPCAANLEDGEIIDIEAEAECHFVNAEVVIKETGN